MSELSSFNTLLLMIHIPYLPYEQQVESSFGQLITSTQTVMLKNVVSQEQKEDTDLKHGGRI